MQETAANPHPRLHLRVTESPGGKDLGRQIALGPSPVVLGRAGDCQLRLGDSAVSRHHVRAELVAGRLRLTDLGSHNGLWTGDELALEADLGVGESFRVGATTLILEPAGSGGEDGPAPSAEGPEPVSWLVEAASQGEPVEVAGNRPALLTDPASVWWVEQGAVDLFVDCYLDLHPVGDRVFVGSFRRGSFLFSAALVEGGSGWSFLATGQPGTRLRRLDRSLLDVWSADRLKVLGLAVAVAPWQDALRDRAGDSGKSGDSVSPAIDLDSTRVFSPADTRDLWPALDRLADAVLRAAKEIRAAESREALAQQQRRGEERRLRERQARDFLGEAGRSEEEAAREPLGPGTSDLLLQTLRYVARRSGIALGDLRVATGRGFEEDVAAISEASRVRVRKVALRGDWWRHDHGPLLGRRLDGSPVALVRSWLGHGYALLDRSTGIEEPLNESRAEQLHPFAFMLYRPLPPGPVASVWRLLLFASARLRTDLLQLVVAGACIGLLGSAIPLITAWLIDDAVTAADSSLLAQCSLGLLAVSLASPVVKVFENFLALRLEGRVDLALQAAVWDRLLSLSPPFFRQYQAGDLEERANAVHRMRNLLAKSGRTAVLGLVSSCFYLVLMFIYSPKLTGVGVATAGVLVLVNLLLALGQFGWQRRLAEREGEVSGTLLQLISGISKIRVAGAESYALYVWARRFAHQLDATVRAGRWQNWGATAQAVFPVIGPLVLFLLAVPSDDPAARSLSTGQFVAFLTAFGLFSAAILSLGEVASKLSEVVPLYRRLRPILQTEPEVDAEKHDAGRLEGEIRLSRVSFRYSPEGPWVLRDVNLDIRPGEFVALVGTSGSGKSTLLRLLLGFERPETGEIYYDGKQLSTLDLRSVRRQLGVVLQNSKPFAADILQNVLGASARTAEDALEAASQAGFDRDIEAMPMKWNTFVGENGSNLSGGQRQRLMIARALVHRPRILFMDEATSALDNRTQAIVSESLDRLSVTRVVVAHRLSTIRNADRIVLLEEGQIRDQGSFEELLARNESFVRLARRQML